MTRTPLGRLKHRVRNLFPPRDRAHGDGSICCTSCGANWSKGKFSDSCDQCGGGALQRSCIVCGGVCGKTMVRAVADSHDTATAIWLGECARTMPALDEVRVFWFGYQTPQQIANRERNPDWDDEDSTSVRIVTTSDEEAVKLGTAFADAFIAELFAKTNSRLGPKPYLWSDVVYGHGVDNGADALADAIRRSVPMIWSKADIPAAARETVARITHRP